ncbi:hypothetical protein DICPUDRAFT_156344 [Dictyostelium purpureum]|uniref:N-acetyltransferase domain-containing protein n=1 Tax=Dictyostelium purpureum TaxID=5786 RepID=F0ZWC0_DICPU|nr:uncharacterized protein DICPUDRAFT_156344 [Dictyostelium purpureum]EGC31765.1 hypothetical protein DICPUDRAFT_156344 [Dictyostelium purpureum]|eukprot:XP_003291716.1 hypothetical protein DICPUDRAFT_156344 [Dictyostelium purpureum]
MIPITENNNNKNKELNVEFFKDKENKLNVKIITERLLIRNVTSDIEDRKKFHKLLTDPINTKKYGFGVQTIDQIDKEYNEWLECWENNDPCGGLMVFLKETNEFIGHVMLMHGKVPGEAEIAIILDKDYQGKQYGTEMIHSMVQQYSLAIINEGLLVLGKPLYTLYATARVDNHGSMKIIQKAGLVYYHQEVLYGFLRNFYRLNL